MSFYTMKINKISIVLLFAFLIFGCKTAVDPSRSFELHMSFWNPTGTNPQVKFDETATSKEVKIDFTKRFASIVEAPSYTRVVIDNFRIIDEANTNYSISSIDAYEYKDESKVWQKDVEFTMKHGFERDLAVVMVLDCSASLGADFLKVKEYAKAFVDQTYLQTPDTQMSIVAFSTTITPSKFSRNKDEIKRIIDAMKQEEFTALYDAMNTGINLMQNVNAQAKVMLTFTDGVDNNSRVSDSEKLVTALKNDNSKAKLASFTIGLQGKGDVDQVVLKKLAANGGVAEFPKTVVELQRVFTRFSKSVSNVYNLTYTRNQQPISLVQAKKLKFVIKATPPL
jgi:Ca-activated chloride channel homolog